MADDEDRRDAPEEYGDAGEIDEGSETPLDEPATDAELPPEPDRVPDVAEPEEPAEAPEALPEGADAGAAPVELEPIDVKAASDEDLMHRCQLGDLASYDELFARYNRASLSFLHRMLGDFGRTESIAQEAFMRIFRDADSYDYPRKFSTWFYTILRNLAKNELRYRSRHYTLSLEEELARSEGQSGLRIRDCLSSAGSGPLQEVLDGELEDRLRQAIDTLPDKAREVLILHRFQGLNYREIAEITAAPLGTVRSRLHSALNHLRKAIRDLL